MARLFHNLAFFFTYNTELPPSGYQETINGCLPGKGEGHRNNHFPLLKRCFKREMPKVKYRVYNTGPNKTSNYTYL